MKNSSFVVNKGSMTKEKKKMPVARLNVNFDTDEERQLLEDVKVAAIRHHMRLKEFLIVKLREVLGSEREGALEKKKK